MTKLWYKLDLNQNGALRDDLDLSFVAGPTPTKEWVWGLEGDDILTVLNEDWLNYMESKKCRPYSVIICYKPPNYRDNIHVDKLPAHAIVENKFRHYTINFIGNPGYMTGDGANKKYKNWKDTGTMRWYNTLPEDRTLCTDRTLDFEYELIRIPESSRVTELDRVNFDRGGLYLANTLTAHGIVTKDQPRLSFSLRGCLGDGTASWEDTVKHFNDTNLIID